MVSLWESSTSTRKLIFVSFSEALNKEVERDLQKKQQLLGNETEVFKKISMRLTGHAEVFCLLCLVSTLRTRQSFALLLFEDLALGVVVTVTSLQTHLHFHFIFKSVKVRWKSYIKHHKECNKYLSNPKGR